MYAITNTGYRAISAAADVIPGETASDTIPELLLATLRAADMRRQRDALLASCDWTQMADSPLDASQKAAWGVYRQALRDVPEQTGFSDTIDWPTQP